MLIPDHDAKVFSPPNVFRRRFADRWLEWLLEGFHRWDAIYFLHVAQHGYTYENSMAFFPLFPLAVRILANTIFFPLQYIFNYGNVLLLSAVVINFILFIKSAQLLYLLGRKVLRNDTLALKAAQLYCINPASVFFSAAYSETLFSSITLAGLLQLESGNSKLSGLILGASGFTRSNGVVNTGYTLYFKLKELVERWKESSENGTLTIITMVVHVLRFGFGCIGYVIVGLLPYALYQVYGYWQYCTHSGAAMVLAPHVRNYGYTQGYRMPSANFPPWCRYTVPYSYSYIQREHWDVGLFNYYEYKQWPNFMLATPMAIICIAASASYITQHVHVFLQKRRAEGMRKKFDDIQIPIPDINSGFTSYACFPYIVHLAFLSTFAILFMHVQVLTRFIASSCPVIYWYVATLTTTFDQLNPGGSNHNHNLAAHLHNHYHLHSNGDLSMDGTNNHANEPPEISDDALDWDSRSRINKIIFVYFHLYFFVGIGAFANFLPWT